MWARMRQKPFALWVIAGGLFYAGLALLALGLPIVIAAGILAGGGFLLILFLFIAVFLISGVFVLREKRWAYIAGAAMSILLLLLFSSNLAASLSNPADSSFWLSISVLPALILVLIFSVLAFMNAKTGLGQKPYLASPKSTGGLLTVAVIGFVIGGLVVGAIGAGVIVRSVTGGPADIIIVPDAMSKPIAYSPQSFTVSVGTTVTWINKDTTLVSHTVTSNVSGQFDSGFLTFGATFSHTFNTAGMYYYHCTPHTTMWGVIVVV